MHLASEMTFGVAFILRNPSQSMYYFSVQSCIVEFNCMCGVHALVVSVCDYAFNVFVCLHACVS